MTNSVAVRGLRSCFIAAAGFLLLFVAYTRFHVSKKPVAPALPVVSSCKELKPGMRRISEQYAFQFNAPKKDQYGFQFDVPEKDFTIHEGTQDAPPGLHGFSLNLKKNSASFMAIEQAEPATMGSVPVPLALIDSGPVGKRMIFDEEGNTVGEDSWGYLDGGERWRRVRLRGRIVVRYGSVNEKDAARYGSVHKNDAESFDQVISSACISPVTGP